MVATAFASPWLAAACAAPPMRMIDAGVAPPPPMTAGSGASVGSVRLIRYPVLVARPRSPSFQTADGDRAYPLRSEFWSSTAWVRRAPQPASASCPATTPRRVRATVVPNSATAILRIRPAAHRRRRSCGCCSCWSRPGCAAWWRWALQVRGPSPARTTDRGSISRWAPCREPEHGFDAAVVIEHDDIEPVTTGSPRRPEPPGGPGLTVMPSSWPPGVNTKPAELLLRRGDGGIEASRPWMSATDRCRSRCTVHSSSIRARRAAASVSFQQAR